MIIVERLFEWLDKVWSFLKYVFLFKWLIRKKSDWSVVLKDLKIGDIGLVDGTGLLSDGIEWFEGLSGEKSRVAHCFIVTDSNGEIVEALSDKIKKQDIKKYFDEENMLIIRRYNADLNATTIAKIKENAYKMIDQPYDYKQFAGLALSYLIIGFFKLIFLKKVGEWIVERFKVYRGAENKIQCSTLVANSYIGAGVVFSNLDPDKITPKTFYDSDKFHTMSTVKGTTNE